MPMALTACLTLPALARADVSEATRARALIDGAVKALGGAKKLARYPAATWKARGSYRPPGSPAAWTFRLQGARQGPDRLALTATSTVDGTTYTRTLVLDGKRGWVKLNDRLTPLAKELLAEEKERQYANWVATLAPLGDKRFRLSLVKPARIDDEEAPGVKVSRESRRDVLLFFSAKTRLLVKRESTIKDLPGSGRTVTEEALFSDYRPTAAGIQHAHKVKVYQDGRLVSETELTEIKPQEKLPDSMFAKP
jgi:hypothetical protein